jgi:hypothetical protein
MSLREANVAARPILESYVKEKQCLPPQRWLADQVGCGNGQVCKLPCYIAVREQLGGGKKVKRPKRITLTSRVEASTGKLDDDLERLKSPDDDTLDGDGALERLLAEQCQDDEGSPVDPQFKPPKRLHRRV